MPAVDRESSLRSVQRGVRGRRESQRWGPWQLHPHNGARLFPRYRGRMLVHPRSHVPVLPHPRAPTLSSPTLPEEANLLPLQLQIVPTTRGVCGEAPCPDPETNRVPPSPARTRRRTRAGFVFKKRKWRARRDLAQFLWPKTSAELNDASRDRGDGLSARKTVSAVRVPTLNTF